MAVQVGLVAAGRRVVAHANKQGMRKVIWFTMLFAWVGDLHAQTEIDLFRYSALRQSPTARMAGMGGAFGALGADVGGSTINPAGIANFRRSTISFSPGLLHQQATGTYFGNAANDGRTRMAVSNLGFVLAQRPNSSSGKWHQLNYGFSMNRTNNYANRQRYEGVNTNSSLIDFFVSEANQDPNEFYPEDFPFSAALAETAGLIFPSIPGNRASNYLGIVPNGGVMQREEISSLGNTSEYNFSVGADYDHKLFLGAGISLMTSKFNQREDFSEFDHMDTIFDFKDFLYRRELGVEADGFMLRLGAILQPVPWFRVGISYESPTRYTVTEDYRTEIQANFDSVPVFAEAVSPLFRPFVYNYRTAGRITGSVAFLFEDKGLISVDYDLVPYDNLRVLALSGDPGSAPWARELNNDVARFFGTTNNLRVGAEYIFGPLAFRAGYAYWGSPFRTTVNTGGGDLAQNDFTTGLGMRMNSLSLDFSVVHARWSNYRSPYRLDGVPEEGVLFSNNRTIATVTVGFRLD